MIKIMFIFSLKNQFIVITFLVLFAFSFDSYSQEVNCDQLFPISEKITNKIQNNTITTYKWGFIDCNGKTVINPTFEKMFAFSDGIGVLFNENDSLLIDAQGNRRFLENYRILTKFSEGLAIVAKKGEYFIIDKCGKIQAKLPEEVRKQEEGYFFAGHFSDGLAPVIAINGVGFVDRSGKFVISPVYDGYTNGFRDGMASVSLNGKSALIDTKGRYIIPPIEDENMNILDASDGLAQVYPTAASTDTRDYMFINKNGDLVLKVNKDYVGSFSEGLAKVTNGDLYGFINKKGEEIISPKYKVVKDFSEGLAAVMTKDLKWGFIDKTGKMILQPTFDSVLRSFENGLAYVYKDDFEGYIDKSGNWIWKRKS